MIGRVVAASTRHPVTVFLLGVVLTGAALVYTAQHFALTADTSELISTKLKWRQNELAFDRAFPQFSNLTMIVVDGATPELADAAATRLTATLQAKPELFKAVRRPDGGAFFDRNGLLLLSLDEVAAATQGLTRARPMLAALAADPSLRGVLATISNALEGIKYGQATLHDVEPAMTALADTFEKAAAGQPAFFSWRTLIAGQPARPSETRHIVLVQPVMDYAALEPGAAASEAIRATARSLGLDAVHGVTVRLTGQVPLSDEEFATLAQDAHLLLGAMFVALLGILWLAVRSARVVIAILVTTIVGLIMTAAIGLLAIGRFNLISVAFIPLFVGLGVDFSIQFSVRSLAERLIHANLRAALIATGATIGRALALSAAAIGAGFFAFLPTSYVGVAELGTIAGLGMIVAFALCIVLLPALLMLLRPPAGRLAEVGFTMLAPVDTLVRRYRRTVLAGALVVAVVSCALLPLVRFDFDPLNLKSSKVESMAALQALSSDPDWTPDAINILSPSLAASEPLVRRLDALPAVSRTVTLNSFVPAQQKEKLALIGNAATLLKPVLDVAPLAPPSDPELQQSLAVTAASLRRVAADATEAAAVTARRLADVLERLQAATPDVRVAAAFAVVTPLRVMLEQTRALLQAGPVTPKTLPPELVADWIAKDGRARIQVLPRDNGEDNASLRRFADAILAIAPDATGRPISISASGDTVVEAFLQAGLYSLLAIILLLAVVLRRARDVVLTMLPVLLSGLLTFATCAALHLPLNFTNIIALPLLFGVGVAFNIYFVLAWRAGEAGMLQSSLMRAVVFSALTTATAFGALWLSSHPGTASMGRLLMISLGWELLVTLLFRPALLAQPPAK
ncbi:MAG TPA: MMPL family transporter [Reyranella sp.]|nr:MMPL family transporter [Reyranella sp.]